MTDIAKAFAAGMGRFWRDEFGVDAAISGVSAASTGARPANLIFDLRSCKRQILKTRLNRVKRNLNALSFFFVLETQIPYFFIILTKKRAVPNNSFLNELKPAIDLYQMIIRIFHSQNY